MKSLNSHVSAETSLNIPDDLMIIKFGYSSQYASFNIFYTYPNEDFCLFKYFPHENLVFPAIGVINQKITCTCTILYLIKHSEIVYKYFWKDDERFIFDGSNNNLYYEYMSIVKNNDSIEYCFTKHYNLTAEKCDLDKMLSKCDKSKYSTFENTPITLRSDTDLFYLVLWLKFILLIILKPLVCFLAIILACHFLEKREA